MAEAVKSAIQSVLSGQADNQAAWIDKEPRNPLRVGSADFPVPRDDEIIVKNHAIAINPVERKIQDYGIFVQAWPFIFGQDVAGEVYAVGKNVGAFQKGDRVLGHYAAQIPSSLSHTNAAVLPLAIDTAGQGLYDSREKGFLGLQYTSLNPTPSGKTLLIWGGSSSVGALAVQLATTSGANVIAVASAHNHAFLESLGAREALDYHRDSVIEDVIAAVRAVGGECAGIYDAISKPDSYRFVLPLIEKLGGGSVAVTLPPPPAEEIPEKVRFGNVLAINPVVQPLWRDYVAPALEQGKLQVVPEALVVGKGLESVQAGLDRSRAGVSAKKVVVDLS